MFGGQPHTGQMFDGIPHYAAQAHQVSGVRDNLSVKGIPELGHLDETPYEHDHVDFDSRFIDHSAVPHHEVKYDAHGIQEPLQDSDILNHDTPTYAELLWAYQHGNKDHVDHRALHSGEEVVHHEDVPYYEAPF